MYRCRRVHPGAPGPCSPLGRVPTQRPPATRRAAGRAHRCVLQATFLSADSAGLGRRRPACLGGAHGRRLAWALLRGSRAVARASVLGTRARAPACCPCFGGRGGERWARKRAPRAAHARGSRLWGLRLPWQARGDRAAGERAAAGGQVTVSVSARPSAPAHHALTHTHARSARIESYCCAGGASVTRCKARAAPSARRRRRAGAPAAGTATGCPPPRGPAARSPGRCRGSHRR